MSYTPNRLKHRIVVGEGGEFRTIEDAITWLDSGNMTDATELLLDSGTWDIANTISIDLPYHLNIRGYDSESVIIQPTTGMIGHPIFELTSSVWFERLTIDGSNLTNYGDNVSEDAITIIGSQYHELTAVFIKNVYNAVNLHGAGSSLWLFNSIIQDITNTGLEVSVAGATSIDIETNTFENCAIAIDLLESTSGDFTILNNVIICEAGQIGIKYTPSTYIYTDDPAIMGNHWNNIGTFRSGFDFTRSDGRDANIHIISNIGDEDKNPHFKVNVVDNSSTTTVTTAGTYYKAVFANGSSYTTKWKLENNKYTYLQRSPSDVRVWIAGNVQVNGNNRNVNISVRKDGVATEISPFTVRTATSGQPYQFSIIAYIDDFAENNYFEIFVTSSTNGDLVIIQDLMIYAEGK